MASYLKNKNNPPEDFKKYISQEKEYNFDEEKRKKDLEHANNILHYLTQLFGQRDKQRNILFNYCLKTISILITLMFIILFFQIGYKIYTEKDLINPSIYNTIFVAIIIQFIGVVYIIAKRLWDSKEEFNCLNDRYNLYEK